MLRLGFHLVHFVIPRELKKKRGAINGLETWRWDLNNNEEKKPNLSFNLNSHIRELVRKDPLDIVWAFTSCYNYDPHIYLAGEATAPMPGWGFLHRKADRHKSGRGAPCKKFENHGTALGKVSSFYCNKSGWFWNHRTVLGPSTFWSVPRKTYIWPGARWMKLLHRQGNAGG